MTDRLTRVLARVRVPLGFACAALVLWCAQPTPATLLAGVAVAFVGEGIRVWAAGHLEKSREVTRSGPYRFLRHPLYVGSCVMGLGLAIACASVPIGILIAIYLSTTITAAIRAENAFLKRTFTDDYAAWQAGEPPAAERRFSLARVWRNREHRAIFGLLVGVVLLILRAQAC
jgi:protein-S-isoprenylcysteine O-methyltransferase Ste14